MTKLLIQNRWSPDPNVVGKAYVEGTLNILSGIRTQQIRNNNGRTEPVAMNVEIMRGYTHASKLSLILKYLGREGVIIRVGKTEKGSHLYIIGRRLDGAEWTEIKMSASLYKKVRQTHKRYHKSTNKKKVAEIKVMIEERDDPEETIPLPISRYDKPTTRRHRKLKEYVSMLDMADDVPIETEEEKDMIYLFRRDTTSRDPRLSVDDKGGVSTPMSNLKEKFRYDVTVEGCHIQALDITASHPVALAVAVKNSYEDTPLRSIWDMGDFCSILDKHILRDSPYFSSISSPSHLTDVICRTTNANKIVEMLMDPEFYLNFLTAKERVYLTRCSELEKKELIKAGKYRFLKQLNWESINENGSLVFRWLGKNIPVLSRTVKEFKRPNYKRLSHLLLRIESHIIVDCAVNRITREHPNYPLYLNRDAIFFPSFVPKEIVGDAVKWAYAQYGVNPAFKYEDYSPPQTI